MDVELSLDQLAYADTRFELLLHRAIGQAYEDIFVQVMAQRYPEFRPVKPQGQLGDRGNDGYSSSRGVYYQVFAPEAENHLTPSSAVKKLGTDFKKLREYWDTLAPIKEYHFVLQ